MKLIRSIAMSTDHNYHGFPAEVTRVDHYISEDVLSPEIEAFLKQEQVRRLHSHAKAMPHVFWMRPEQRPYADELPELRRGEQPFCTDVPELRAGCLRGNLPTPCGSSKR